MTQAEPPLQHLFSKWLPGAVLIAIVMFARAELHSMPDRVPGPARVVSGQASEVKVGGGMRAWRLYAADPRFGGLSALAVSGGELVALTDSGVVARFAPPVGSGALRVALRDLPDGPGRPRRKSGRDSESLAADPAGRGWWVGFEFGHALYLFDAEFERTLASRRLAVDWPKNRGAEALVAADGKLLALPELGGRVFGGPYRAPRWTADATRLADGRLVLLVRKPTWRGFVSEVRIGAGAGHAARRIALDLGTLDNVEGVAAVAVPGGGTRLWIVSDDNFRPWMRTLLVALDLPAGA